MPTFINTLKKSFSWPLVFILFLITIAIKFYSPIRQTPVPEYHFLHTILEVSCVMVSVMIFVVISVTKNANYSRGFQIFGYTFLGVGVLDTLHVLAVLGAPSIIALNSSRQESISFWIAARILETIALAIFLFDRKQTSKKNPLLSIVGVFFFVAITSWLVYFHKDLVPFVDSQGNLTKLKVIIEILIMLQHIIFAYILIRRQYGATTDRRLHHLTTATMIFAVAGICFADYGLGNNMELFWGHILKVFAYFYIFKATLQAELITPYNQLSNLNTLVMKQSDSIRELQNKMLEAERVGSIGLGVGSVIHDLNNMLQVVDHSSKKIFELTSEMADSDQIHKYSEFTIKTVEKTRDLQRLLLSRARGKDFGEEKSLNPYSVIAEFIPLIESILDSSLSLELAGEKNSLIRCSRAEFEQLLLNLIVNARDAIPNNIGKIKITLAVLNLSTPEASLNSELPPGKYVRLSVADSGTGMSEETINKIFTPTYSNKKSDNSGFGLGLFTVMEITKRWGGWVQVRSQVGVGTEFLIWFKSAGET